MKTSARSTTVLRHKAEELLEKQRKAVAPVPAEDAVRLVHELQVHQIELELQNEELSKAYAEVAALRDKYLDLYDSAPVGYFTVTQAGDIVELNLSAARLLGETQAMLVGRRLQNFVQAESAGTFAEFLTAAGKATATESITLTLRHTGGGKIYVKAQGRLFESDISHGKEVRIMMMDVTELRDANDELLRSFERFFKYWRP